MVNQIQDQSILAIQDLNVRFGTRDGVVSAVNDVSFQIGEGESVGIVGESGSGKSQIFMSIMGLLASNGQASGSIRFMGQELLGLSTKEMNKIRGSAMAMIFQDPMTSLNPYMRVGKQLEEVPIVHEGLTHKEAKQAAIDALDLVRIPEAKRRFEMYPHEFSGGMRQRVMIAMALMGKPKLLIADEPTTALDVTIQAQVLDIIQDLRKERNMAVVMITHDLGVVAGVCDRILVVYAGRIVETGSAEALFSNPQHPYTEALLKSVPRLDLATEIHLDTIRGQPPNLQSIPQGCPFAPRCRYVMPICNQMRPPLEVVGGERKKACHLEGLGEGFNPEVTAEDKGI